jgi:hypothetical protein
VLEAFNTFKEMNNEVVRFQTMVQLLKSERDNIAVMVAAMAFINVVVHCVPDMNFQVALQHEFTMLGIIPVLELLEKQDAPELHEQIEAYQDNFLNVAELSKDSELHQQDLEVIEELEDDIKELQVGKQHPTAKAPCGSNLLRRCYWCRCCGYRRCRRCCCSHS